MLRITIPGREFWDEVNNEFVSYDDCELKLEHSLVSLSKWESKWQKPFLTTDMNGEQTLDYIKIMTINSDVDPEVYTRLTQENIETIRDYISNPMTATTFRKDQSGKRNNEIVTAELIYYWMIAYNIPFDCQKWHLNRLLTLIQVCEVKNNPNKKKMSMNEIYSQNSSINAARRKAVKAKR